MNLQLKDIKLLSESGSLFAAEIVEVEEMYGAGFTLWFMTSNDTPVTVRTQRNACIVKMYKSLPSAVKVLNSLGFKNFMVTTL